uniref:Pallidipin-like lipocalin 2 n=1 Tax=Rhodnius prolixus TaxID=13249 RepID=Q7YT01_RHOPR|nr:pallidipin-like lipocalin 2 precursor [Rhodnius prolixus]
MLLLVVVLMTMVLIFTKCYDVTPMSDFNSNKFFEKPKHMYVTHSRYEGRPGVCREFYFTKHSNGSLSFNYDFNGNGKPEGKINSYTMNCTGTKDSYKKRKISLVCYQKFDWNKHLGHIEFEDYEDEEEKEVVEEVVEKAEENAKNYDRKLSLKLTVLSTDYEEYALIHMCVKITLKGKKFFADNYVVFNIQEDAKLPEVLKTKFKEYGWEEDTFVTREMCKNAGSKKKV